MIWVHRNGRQIRFHDIIAIVPELDKRFREELSSRRTVERVFRAIVAIALAIGFPRGFNVNQSIDDGTPRREGRWFPNASIGRVAPFVRNRSLVVAARVDQTMIPSVGGR